VPSIFSGGLEKCLLAKDAVIEFQPTIFSLNAVWAGMIGKDAGAIVFKEKYG